MYLRQMDDNKQVSILKSRREAASNGMGMREHNALKWQKECVMIVAWQQMEEQLNVFIAPAGNRTHAGLRML